MAGTFNVVRDRDKIGADKFRQDVVFLALTQGQLKERAKGLAAQIVARVGQADPMMKDIAGHLEAAAAVDGGGRAEAAGEGREECAAGRAAGTGEPAAR